MSRKRLYMLRALSWDEYVGVCYTVYYCLNLSTNFFFKVEAQSNFVFLSIPTRRSPVIEM